MFYDIANWKSLSSFVKQFLSVIVLLDGLPSNLSILCRFIRSSLLKVKVYSFSTSTVQSREE